MTKRQKILLYQSLIIGCFILVYFEGYSQANNILAINLYSIDLIAFSPSNTNFHFYEKVSPEQYQEISLNFDDSNQFIHYSTYKNPNTESLQSIIQKYDQHIQVNQIKSTKNTTIPPQGFEYQTNKNTKQLLKFSNSGLGIYQTLSLRKKEKITSFGLYITHTNDKAKRWRLEALEYYSIVKLCFGSDKVAYLFLQPSTNCLFLQLKTGSYFIDENKVRLPLQTTTHPPIYEEIFRAFEHEYYYTLYQTKDNKYNLFNPFGIDILGSDFDTIIFNQYFIIAQQNQQYYIFNTFLERLNFHNIKCAYLYRSYLEILSDDGAYYYNEQSNIVKKPATYNYILCGTVHSESYKLMTQDFFRFPYTLLYQKRGLGKYIHEKQSFNLQNITKKYTLSFLDNTDYIERDGNDDYMGVPNRYPNYLKISRRGKNGIVQVHYPYPDDTFHRLNDTITDNAGKVQEINYFPDLIEPKIVLPIQFKSIVYNQEDGLIYFYKKKKVGIFPRHQTVQYEAIKRKTNSFYSIKRDGKKGWLDIHTNKEYFD